MEPWYCSLNKFNKKMGVMVSLERLMVDPEIRLARHRADLRLKSLALSGIEQEIEVAREKIVYFHSLGPSKRHELNQWASRYKELEINRATQENVCNNLVRLVSLASSTLSIRNATKDLRFITHSAKVLKLDSEAIDQDADRFEQDREDAENQLIEAEDGVDDISASLAASSELRNAGLDAIIQKVVAQPPPAFEPTQTYTPIPSVHRTLSEAPAPPVPAVPREPPPPSAPLLALLM